MICRKMKSMILLLNVFCYSLTPEASIIVFIKASLSIHQLLGEDEGTCSQTLGGAQGTPRKRGYKDCRSQWCQRHHKKTHRTNEPSLIGANRNWINNNEACMVAGFSSSVDCFLVYFNFEFCVVVPLVNC